MRDESTPKDDRMPRCAAGHPMDFKNRFRFDHDATDTARATLLLLSAQLMGVELGAEVTVWSCPRCDVMEAMFAYPSSEYAEIVGDLAITIRTMAAEIAKETLNDPEFRARLRALVRDRSGAIEEEKDQ